MMEDMLSSGISWISGAIQGTFSTFIGIFHTNPILGLAVMIIALALVVMISSFIINSTYTVTQLGMWIFIAIILAVVAYVVWTQLGVGGGISTWLMGLFGGA